MKQLATALKDSYDNSSTIGRMVQRSTGNRKRLLPNVRKRKPKNKTTMNHEQEVLYTLKHGYGPMRPCNMIAMKPGANVLAHGRRAVVKWCLMPPNSKVFVMVVMFDDPQDIRGKHGVRSRWAMIESEFVEKIKW
jgi:hypothetical protein